jgi:hypothetical protein
MKVINRKGKCRSADRTRTNEPASDFQALEKGLPDRFAVGAVEAHSISVFSLSAANHYG